MGQVRYFTNPAEYISFVMNGDVVINDVNIISANMVRVRFSQEEALVGGLCNTNVVVAAFTTALARLELYKCMEQLGKRLVYFDTDSVIFESPIAIEDEPVKVGDAMGCLTDELQPGEVITQFVSGGAKNYAYKTNKGRTQMTVKGITLTSNACEVVNFETLKKMVLGQGPDVVHVTSPRKFILRPVSAEVRSTPYTKSFKVVYDKRILLDDYTTLPYGYKE